MRSSSWIIRLLQTHRDQDSNEYSKLLLLFCLGVLNAISRYLFAARQLGCLRTAFKLSDVYQVKSQRVER
jgi:hypothetical protein